MYTVVIISTGNELLSGKTIDTNSSFISNKLFNTDLNVKFHLTLGDDPEELKNNIQYSIDQSDIIIITGGLGPTDDDNTVNVLKDILNIDSYIHEESKNRMKAVFQISGRSFSENDLKMAEVPCDSIVILNNYGLAPGFIITKNNKTIIAMPGVPNEMQNMFNESIYEYLKNNYIQNKCEIVSYKVIGLKESDINNSIKESNIPINKIIWGITSNEGIVTLSFVQKDDISIDFQVIDKEIKIFFMDKMLLNDFNTPEEELISLLKDNNLSIVTAESCTGGLIAKRITDIPGSSEIFFGSIIAYSDQVKNDFLKVKKSTISKNGAVSEETAKEMCKGIRNVFNADIGVSVTGIAGPGGGSAEKPVGTVCFGYNFKGEITTYTKNFVGSRQKIRNFASLIAIDYLRRELRKL